MLVFSKLISKLCMSFREIIFVTEEGMRFYQVQPLKVQRKIDFVFDLEFGIWM